MAKKPKKQEVPKTSAEYRPVITITIDYWARPERRVQFATREGALITSVDAINLVSSSTGYTSAEIGQRIGVAKKTVQGWRTGKTIAVAPALRLQSWLSSDPMMPMMEAAQSAAPLQSGDCCHPAGGQPRKKSSK
jgi:hypothetical protein